MSPEELRELADLLAARLRLPELPAHLRDVVLAPNWSWAPIPLNTSARYIDLRVDTRPDGWVFSVRENGVELWRDFARYADASPT